jgi:pimeloyl-ACP methyl ester carboxylesterase
MELTGKVYADDGVEVRAVAQGDGPRILIVHGGHDDGSSWRRVAELLSPRWRVVGLHRRQYRLDLAASLPCSIAREADDVLTLAEAVGGPVVLVGHSSGGVVALEALVRSPSRFAGAVLYEPPVHLRPREWDAALTRIAALAARGRITAAMRVHLRDIVRLPGPIAWLAALGLTASSKLRALAPHQIDDDAAINDLGVRLDAYGRIDVPTVLLGGDRSPAHLTERLDALSRTVPGAVKVVLRGQGHVANVRAPGEVARVIEDLASRVVGGG